MPNLLRTLLICSLLILGAATPAAAASHPAHDGEVTAHSVHILGTDEDHSP